MKLDQYLLLAYILQHVTAVPISQAVASGPSVSFMSSSTLNIPKPTYLQQLTVVIFPPYPNIVTTRKQIILFIFYQLSSKLEALLKLICISVLGSIMFLFFLMLYVPCIILQYVYKPTRCTKFL